jgi:prepilin-type N-terminal cleavage/methylation domain-containing protein
MKNSQKGFTLVEIAIVLVIIGLLLGGILKGQEMITQAKIKNVIADMTGVSAAMYGYQDRYRALPGDDRNASTRWTAPPALPAPVANTGNGTIEGTYNSVTPTDESRLFWDHLRRAGFISGAGNEQPFNAVSGRSGVQTGDGAGGAVGVLGVANPPNTQHFNSLILCTANLPDKIAGSIDAQMDDGNGQSGSVRALAGGGNNPPIPPGQQASAYVEDGVTTFVICRQM